jgi:hypothetical protein
VWIDASFLYLIFSATWWARSFFCRLWLFTFCHGTSLLFCIWLYPPCRLRSALSLSTSDATWSSFQWKDSDLQYLTATVSVQLLFILCLITLASLYFTEHFGIFCSGILANEFSRGTQGPSLSRAPQWLLSWYSQGPSTSVANEIFHSSTELSQKRKSMGWTFSNA